MSHGARELPDNRSAMAAPWWRVEWLVVLVLLTAASLAAPSFGGSIGASAVGGVASSSLLWPPRWTTSHYEPDARRAALFHQGLAAGRSNAQGIVILDFGRPAERHGVAGTIDYGGSFLSLAATAVAVRSYVSGYFHQAPPDTTLDVAIGTNNSCGPGQPCGGLRCGCADEPASLLRWGEELASVVERDAAWANQLRASRGYTDVVRVVAADDIEPAYDPGYLNTYEVLDGYALAVKGSAPPMVDYGSADPNIWSEARLYQVAYGFPPDVPMPEIYFPGQAGEWAALLRYAKARLRTSVTFFGVLTGGLGTEAPRRAYAELLAAVAPISPQRQIPWLSAITPPSPAQQLGQAG